MLSIQDQNAQDRHIVKSFMKNGITYETTEVTEKHSVSSEKADKKAETSGGGK
jgi:hypothetical protein